MPKQRKKVVVGIGAGREDKKYPAEKWVTALESIAKKDVVFIIMGGKTESQSAEFIVKHLPSETVLNLCGKTTLRETAAVLSQADFFIGHDTGISHMAAILDIPVLILYQLPKDATKIIMPFFCEFCMFPPLTEKNIMIHPENIFGDFTKCAVSQIPPEEVVAGFEELEKNVCKGVVE